MKQCKVVDAYGKALVQAQRTDLRGYRFRKFQRQALKFYKHLMGAK